MSQTGPWNPYSGTPPTGQGPTWNTQPSTSPRPSWQPVTWSTYPSMPTYPAPSDPPTNPPSAFPQSTSAPAYPRPATAAGQWPPATTRPSYPQAATAHTYQTPTSTYPPPTTTPVFPSYPPPSYPPGYPPPRTPYPWGTPLPIPPGRARQPSRLPLIIIGVVVFMVVAPIASSIMSSLLDPVPPTPTRTTIQPTRSTPAPRPTTQGSGTYTAGTPDLHPDEPPMPTSYSQIDQMLMNNPLYSTNLPATNCNITDIDLLNAPIADIELHMNAFVDCLMAAWTPAVTAAKFTLPHPSVTVYTTEIITPCGQLPLYNAIYCSADQQIYYAQNLIQVYPWELQTMRFLAESVIAHEFGHTVQYRTMILMSEAILENEATTDAEEMEYSRRLEMQADCFAGVFLDSITASADMTINEEANIVMAFRAMGGTAPYSDDHGTGDNRAYWATQGLNSTTPGICGTFAADASLVS